MNMRLLNLLYCNFLFIVSLAACDKGLDIPSPETYSSLSLSAQGEVVMELNTETGTDYLFSVAKGEGSNSWDETVKLTVWSQSKLNEYNEEHSTSYRLLPSNIYMLTTPQLGMSADVKEVEGMIQFDFEKMMNLLGSGIEYVLPVSFSANKSSFVSGQDYIILKPKLTNTAMLTLESSDQRLLVVGGTASVGISYMDATGEISSAPNNIHYKLVVPDDASTLVRQYNTANHTQYLLAPKTIYTLGKGTIEKNRFNSSAEIEIDQNKVNEVFGGSPYLLPIKVVDESGNILGKGVRYLVCPAYKEVNDSEGKHICVYTCNSSNYLDIYYADAENTNAVLFFVGGGYGSYSGGEWNMVKDVFASSHGTKTTLVISHYRFPEGNPDIPMEDAYDALKIMNAMKGIWGIDKMKVGVMGCSAGGHLASSMAVNTPQRLNFQILFYPVITMQIGKTHEGSRINLLGKNPSQELIDKYSNELHITSNNPPAYVAYSKDDPIITDWQDNVVAYVKALKTANVPVSEWAYDTGGHWYGNWPDYQTNLRNWLNSVIGNK